VLSTGTGEVIGCVYIYPPRGDSHGGASAGEHDAAVSSGRGDCPAGRLVRRPRAVPQRFRSLAASSESQCGVDGGTRSRVVRLIGFEDCHHRLCAPRGIPREVPACSEQSRLPHLPWLLSALVALVALVALGQRSRWSPRTPIATRAAAPVGSPGTIAEMKIWLFNGHASKS